MDYDPSVTVHKGTWGRATLLELPDRPDAAETVCGWLITAPVYHPLWAQYSLCVVRLRDGISGFPEPHRKFIGATHELIVFALNPDDGPYKPAGFYDRPASWLTPINIIQQWEATDDEMAQLAWFAAWAVVAGHLNPETADAPALIREGWLNSMVKTLAHIRGEEHAP